MQHPVKSQFFEESVVAPAPSAVRYIQLMSEHKMWRPHSLLLLQPTLSTVAARTDFTRSKGLKTQGSDSCCLSCLSRTNSVKQQIEHFLKGRQSMAGDQSAVRGCAQQLLSRLA